MPAYDTSDFRAAVAPSAPPATLSRRAFGRAVLAGATALGAGSLLAACSSDGSPAAPSGSASSAAPAANAFPASVTHKYATTVVPRAPQRVVSVGYTEQDVLLALGIVPVGVTDWYGDQPYATWPWAKDKLGSAQPTVLTIDDGFQFERIAALRPDLVLGTNSGMQAADYKKLSALAPTIAQSGSHGDWFEPWASQTANIGAAVGKPAETTKLIADTKSKFSAAAAANPAFKGKKAIFLQNAVYEGSVIAYPRGLSTEFLTDLGFEVPRDIDPYVREGEQAYIPVERLSVLNAADVLIWATESDKDKTALEKVPGFLQLSAVKTGRSIYTGPILAGAIYFTSPLSLPYVVDELVPMLAAVL